MFENLSLTVPVPCIQGSFGDKLQTFQTQVKPSQIQSLLGHDPRSKNWPKLPDDLQELYEYLQRKTNKERRSGTRRYILERIVPGGITLGAFPAISIGLVRPAQFTSYRELYSHPEIPLAVGKIDLDLSPTNLRILLDGLGRVTGPMDLIEEGDIKSADSFAFPLTIYAPTTMLGEISARELGQLFHDFNFLQTPVSTAQAVDLDQSNIYVVLTNQLANSAPIAAHGGVEARAMSLGKKSTALVAKPVLLRFVKGACEGSAFQHTLRDFPEEDANLTRASFNQIKSEIEAFLSQLEATMGDRFEAKDSVLLTAPGWNALGIVFHDIFFRLRDQMDVAVRNDIVRRIGEINWSRSNPDWVGLLGQRDDDSVGGLKMHGGYKAITGLANFMRERSGLAAHLAARGLVEQFS